LSNSCPECFTLRKSTTLTKSIGGQAGFKANIDILEKRKISFPYQAVNHKSSVLKPTA
jgi:hypothetical protein